MHRLARIPRFVAAPTGRSFVMARIEFTHNVQRHLSCPSVDVAGPTVRDVLDAAFADNESARGYFLDDQGAVRKHIVIFVDGRPIHDRDRLSDPVSTDSKIYLMQALSGG